MEESIFKLETLRNLDFGELLRLCRTSVSFRRMCGTEEVKDLLRRKSVENLYYYVEYAFGGGGVLIALSLADPLDPREALYTIVLDFDSVPDLQKAMDNVKTPKEDHVTIGNRLSGYEYSDGLILGTRSIKRNADVIVKILPAILLSVLQRGKELLEGERESRILYIYRDGSAVDVPLFALTDIDDQLTIFFRSLLDRD